MINYNEAVNKPLIEKKVMWEFTSGYLELYDDSKKFSSVDMSDFTGNYWFFNSKETKWDIDIYKIIIENHFDSDTFKWALFPGFSELNPEPLDHMVKFRLRDKFVFVKDAPWKVFDQFEIFLNSMSVKLTRKFYEKLNKFMLFKEEQKKRDELQSMEDEKKISILMPSRDATYLESSCSALEEDNFVQNKHCTDINRDSNEDSDSDSKNERSQTNYFETKTRNYNKYQMKAVNFHDKKRGGTFSLNNISKKISNTFKTMRNIKKKQSDDTTAFPIYFRYFRINEIGVSLTYKHSDNSMLNTKNLRIIIKPFIKHSKFVPIAKMLNKYEKFWKKSLIYQIPSIIKQKLLKITLSKDEDDDDTRYQRDGNQKLVKAKKILFGKYYDYD